MRGYLRASPGRVTGASLAQCGGWARPRPRSAQIRSKSEPGTKAGKRLPPVTRRNTPQIMQFGENNPQDRPLVASGQSFLTPLDRRYVTMYFLYWTVRSLGTSAPFVCSQVYYVVGIEEGFGRYFLGERLNWFDYTTVIDWKRRFFARIQPNRDLTCPLQRNGAMSWEKFKVGLWVFTGVLDFTLNIISSLLLVMGKMFYSYSRMTLWRSK